MSEENSLSWLEMDKKVALGLAPSQAKIWKFSHCLVQSALLFSVCNFLLHTIPAIFLDFVALLFGKKRIYSKMMKKLTAMILVFLPFVMHRWTFGNKNYKRLVEETKDFKFQRGKHSLDFQTIDWDEYFKNFLPGVNRHVELLTAEGKIA